MITPEEIAKRRDMRQVLAFTIDPKDAKDFDDALSFQVLENGNYEIGVHIADVSHYVKEGTILDDEAYNRATSVYLVDRVVPMLPEVLSNFACSLRPNEEKYTFSAVFELTPKAEVVNQWFGRTVIYSDQRFAYEEAQSIIETQSDLIPAEVSLTGKRAGRTQKNHRCSTSKKEKMTDFLIKSTISLLVFLVFYHWVLEREKTHQFNRFYLLLAIVISLAIPFLSFEIIQEVPVTTTTEPELIPIPFSNETIPVVETIDYTSIIVWSLYGLTTLLLSIRFGKNIWKLISKSTSNPKVKYKNATLVLVDEKTLPHTFLNHIFINFDDYNQRNIEDELYSHNIYRDWETDRKSTRLNSSHSAKSRMPSSA